MSWHLSFCAILDYERYIAFQVTTKMEPEIIFQGATAAGLVLSVIWNQKVVNDLKSKIIELEGHRVQEIKVVATHTKKIAVLRDQLNRMQETESDTQLQMAKMAKAGKSMISMIDDLHETIKEQHDLITKLASTTNDLGADEIEIPALRKFHSRKKGHSKKKKGHSKKKKKKGGKKRSQREVSSVEESSGSSSQTSTSSSSTSSDDSSDMQEYVRRTIKNRRDR